jgi:hypothetical protein
MTLRKTRILETERGRHWIALCGELVLAEAIDVSEDRLRNECGVVWQ